MQWAQPLRQRRRTKLDATTNSSHHCTTLRPLHHPCCKRVSNSTENDPPTTSVKQFGWTEVFFEDVVVTRHSIEATGFDKDLCLPRGDCQALHPIVFWILGRGGGKACLGESARWLPLTPRRAAATRSLHCASRSTRVSTFQLVVDGAANGNGALKRAR